jgi:pyridoxine/pyridoxamine 5'-phosphate oxidase
MIKLSLGGKIRAWNSQQGAIVEKTDWLRNSYAIPALRFTSRAVRLPEIFK